MNQEQEELPTQARTALEKCFAQIRLARATELAESRRFHEAEAVLVQNGELPGDARELDLLARIAAQQAHFDEAHRLWQRAVELEPGNETYKQCLESLTLPRRIGRLIAVHQDELLNILALATVAFAIGTMICVFWK